MNIVMPMAGRGHRFVEAGIDVPKPLIDVRGRPMYAWATDGLPLDEANRLIFICLAEHLADRALETDIRSRYGSRRPVIVALDEVTQGQACTVLTARKWIDNDEPLLIFNADTYCPTTVAAAARRFGRKPPESSTCSRPRATNGALLDSDPTTACWRPPEKRRISDWASTGLYYFRRGSDFVAACPGHDRCQRSLRK